MIHARIREILIIMSVLSAMLPQAVSAQDVAFQARVDKTRLAFEDVLVLTLTLSGGNLDMNVSPELPDFKDDFDILRGPNRSTSISIVNGRQSSSLTIQYMLSPKKTGTLIIEPATLTYNGQTYATQPISIEVFQGTPPASPDGDGQAESEVPDVFLRAEIEKTTAYIGEQITIAYYLYTRVNISQYDLAQQPAFTGFWVEEIEVPQPPTLESQTLNGVQYGVALLKKVALFPTASGPVTIDPLVMSFGVRVQNRGRDPFGINDPFDSFFGRTQELIRKTQPLELTILPLPEEGRPEHFNGDVGQFTMAVEVDTTEVTQDDAMTLTVTIQGNGNIKTVKEPLITLPDSFKRYDPEIKEQMYALQEPLQGEKTFTSVLIPSEPGEFRIEPVQFAYFDPQRKAYQTLRSEALDVVILPSEQSDEPMARRITRKEDIAILDQDIRFINTSVTRLADQSRYLHQRPFFAWGLALPLLLIPLMAGYAWYRGKYQQDEARLRGKRARKLSRQRFSEAAALLQEGDDKGFYAVMSQALRHYLGDKLHQPPASITADSVAPLLTAQGLDEASVKALQTCLAQCDFARFAPVGSSREEMADVLRNAEALVDRIEQLRIQPGARGPKSSSSTLLAAPLIVWLLTCPGSAAQALEDDAMMTAFQEGNSLYENEQYEEAAQRYQAILESGLQNGYVYYNLGNALLKQERLGEAILAYERARRLLPRDEAVAFNVNYARAMTVDDMGHWDSGMLARALKAVRGLLTLNEAALTFWVSYLIVVGLIAAFPLASGHWKIRILRIGLLPLLVAFFSGILLVLHLMALNTDDAIVLSPRVEARTGPGESYSTVFEIHEGANVRIQREKGAWSEIQLPNKVIGWVQHTDIERIMNEPEL